MSARSKARKRALDVLYGADVRGEPLADALATEEARSASQPQRASSWDYARTIVEGVLEHGARIDEVIDRYSERWPLARMPAVDRAILRIGVWELLYNPDVPQGVAIAEAVEFATVLSTEDSAGFVNGLLGRIARDEARTAS